MSTPQRTWFEANQRYLTAAMAEVRIALEAFLSGGLAETSAAAEEARAGMFAAMAQPPSLEVLSTTFGLSSFERKILLLCAGVELDSRFAALWAGAEKNVGGAQPVFSLALSAFPDAHWTALSPARPLRRWQLIDVLPGGALTTSPLRIDERVLHYLAGVTCVDERLRPVLAPPAPAQEIAPSHQAIAQEIATAWSRSASLLPIVQLCGDEVAARRSVAAAAAARVGLGLHIVDTRGIRASFAEVGAFLRLLEREAVLGTSALLLECEDPDTAPGLPESVLVNLIEQVRSPVMVATRVPRHWTYRSTVLFDVGKPKPVEQADLWHRALDPACPDLNGQVAALVSQFSFNPASIRSAAEQALRGLPDQPVGRLPESLWDICRTQARPRLEGMAQRIEAAAGWDDLVLPERQAGILREIAIHVCQRAKVYQEWGFLAKGSRGLGISALFAGPSGTGKTMAGEVLARELRLDLYRIDLSQVVSKYIGETEKNLRRVFDAAEEGAAILLFDEADALFGKRSEVKDSHDRYANIEVSYLLQRMESYRGLAILTTNRKSALDPAFLRRLRFVVEFPFPDAPQRAEIWRRIFPRETPVEGLRYDRLARLNATGGHIRNIALCGAFLAAHEGAPVGMRHLLSAARSEFAKLEKPLTEAELAGWV
jgi:hypothetical protein